MIWNRLAKAWITTSAIILLSACGGGDNDDGGDATDAQGNAGRQLASASAIRILSNRADLISGGDVLIEVVPPAGAALDNISMRLNGDNVTGQFSETDKGNLRGLVTGLKLGKNTFIAQLSGRSAKA